MPQERRTKARHEGPTREQPSTSQALPTLILDVGKSITIGKRIDFEFLIREDFSIEVKIKNMSLRFFYSLDLPIYPNFVKEFYGIITRGSEGFH